MPAATPAVRPRHVPVDPLLKAWSGDGGRGLCFRNAVSTLPSHDRGIVCDLAFLVGFARAGWEGESVLEVGATALVWMDEVMMWELGWHASSQG